MSSAEIMFGISGQLQSCMRYMLSLVNRYGWKISS